MRIGHIAKRFPKRSETFILNQITGLLDKDNTIDIYAMYTPNNPVEHQLIPGDGLDGKVAYGPDPESYFDGAKELASAIPAILSKGVSIKEVAGEFTHGTSSPRRIGNQRMILEAPKPDLFHIHFGTTGLQYLPALKNIDTPWIISFYGRDASQIPANNPNVYEEMFAATDGITCLSGDMRQDLISIGAPKEKIHKVPLSIPTDKFDFSERNLESDEPVKVLSVARLVEKKGLEYAIRAINEIERDCNIEYNIAGEGPLRGELEELTANLGLDDTVDFLGWQDQTQINELMHKSHIFLLPSVKSSAGDKEGTPTVLLEAQSTGLPVISTHHAGIPEIIQDGESGLLVPERDVQRLSESLQNLIDDSNKWPRYGTTGRNFVEDNHSIESVTNTLENLYKSLV